MSRKPGFHDVFVRIPEELWRALTAEAQEENRSATAQLTTILKERYKPKPKGKKKDDAP